MFDSTVYIDTQTLANVRELIRVRTGWPHFGLISNEGLAGRKEAF